MFRPFFTALLSCCFLAPACAQYTTFPATTCSVCNGAGCNTSSWGLFRSPRTVTRSYSGPLIQRSVTRSVSPVVVAAPTVSTPTSVVYTQSSSAPRSSGYTTRSDGQLQASDGGLVCAGDGTKLVSKAWADQQIAAVKSEGFASTPTCNCSCGDLEAKIDSLTAEVKSLRSELAPFREEKQSSLEDRIQRQLAERAITLAGMNSNQVAQR